MSRACILILSLVLFLNPLMAAVPGGAADWTPTWGDDFNGTALDTSKWMDSYPWGRYTGWTQEYTAPENVTVSGGSLHIKVENRPQGGVPYSSGAIASSGHFEQLFGYFECRAKMASGKGLLSAFWQPTKLPTWPPEVDCIEVLGKDPTVAFTTVHWDRGFGHEQSSDGINAGSDLTAGYHTYGVEIGPDAIIWYIDDIEKKRVAGDGALWARGPIHIIANVHVGAGWPGFPDASNVWPQYMDIDYIRCYQRTAVVNDATPPTQPGAVQVTSLTPGTATLSWGASTDDVQLGCYDIFRNGTLVRSVYIGTSCQVLGFTPGTTSTVTVRARDVKGNLSTPATVSITSPAAIGEALMVVSNDDLTYAYHDRAIMGRMEAKGLWVRPRNQWSSSAADASGKRLVYLSNSIDNATSVTSKFRDVAVPVIVTHDELFPHMGMTSGAGNVDFGGANQNQVEMTGVNHPLAAGLSGIVPVCSVSNTYLTWGKPLASAITVARVPGQASQSCSFGYETGAALAGLSAPARRVGLFPRTPQSGNYSDQGYQLIDAAIAWAAGLSAQSPGFISLLAPNASIAEGGGSASVAVRRSGGSDGAVSVAFATNDGTATAGSDYAAVSGTVSWAAGDTADKTISLPITQDSAPELNESFTLAIMSATGGASLGTQVSMTVTIQDDDLPPGSSFAFGVNLNGPAVTIDGNAWLSFASAQTGGLSVANASPWAGTYTAALNPTPTATTRTMMESILYRSNPPNGQGWSLAQPLANGTYDVYVWSIENWQSNFRDMDLRLEGQVVASGIGDQPMWDWQRYGPYRTTISDGVLSLDVVRRSKGDPMLAGLAVYRVTSGPSVQAPLFVAQPTDQTVSTGQPATFSVGATGYPSPTFQWSSAPSGGSVFAPISGATGTSYTTVAATSGMSGYRFRCVATNSAGTATSTVATLTVDQAQNTPPRITGAALSSPADLVLP